jgi:hypothetical protein
MTEPVDATMPLRRGNIRVSGRPVVQHQLDLALAFACDRVICLVKSLEPEVIALQHRTEAAGKVFNTVSAPRDLSALITAADDVIVLHEGLLADTGRARALLEQGQGVFVLPVETGLASGFERIDINNAVAGMMRIPGRLIEALLQITPDCDVPSALTRIALQSGISLRNVPAEARTGTQWLMIASEEDAHAIEPDWIAERLLPVRLASPGRWVARHALLAFGSSLLHAGNASRIMIGAGLAALALALGTGWLGASTAGFLLCALAWICLHTAASLKGLEAPLTRADIRFLPAIIALDWGFDAALVVLIVWAAPPLAGTSLVLGLAMPVTFLLLVRLAGTHPAMTGAGTFSDRTLLSLLLAGFTVVGLVDWAVALGAVGLAGALIAATRRRGD